jgi:hypothetical protein
MRVPSWLKLKRRVWRVFAVLLYWYLAAYVLMMDWRYEAYDPSSLTSCGESAYRMALLEITCVDVTMACDLRCWANRLFWPIDAALGWAKKRVGLQETPPKEYPQRSGGDTALRSPRKGTLCQIEQCYFNSRSDPF